MHANVRRIKGLEETINKYAHTLSLRSQQLEICTSEMDRLKDLNKGLAYTLDQVKIKFEVLEHELEKRDGNPHF